PGEVGADEVALDQGAEAGTAGEVDAGAVTGDDIAGAAGGAPDGITRSRKDINPRAVAKGFGPGPVGADEIAFDQVAGGSAAKEAEAIRPVAGDDIAGGGG